jgi:hypothetical protein
LENYTCIEGGGGGGGGEREGGLGGAGGGGGLFVCNYDYHRNLPYFPYHFTIQLAFFSIFSISFHYSTYFSSIFSISFPFATYFVEIQTTYKFVNAKRPSKA